MAKCFFCDHRNAPDVTQCKECGAEISTPDRQAQSAEPSTADKTEDSAAEEESTDPFEKQLIDLLRQGKKIPAIKIYREQKGTGLKFSKEAVEALAAKHGIAKTGSGCASVLLVALFFVVVLVVYAASIPE